ncbi:tRNA lysidine(34) synthetase TilS [Patescibacteria group bacterium]
MKQLIKKIKNFAFQHDLWNEGDKIIVGVSGGPDSVCLLNILTRIAPKYNLKLRIAHVNYGIREKDADRDEKIVRELAKKYKLQIDALKFKSDHFSKIKNLENNLRDVRYGFFSELKEKHGFNSIAIAHNQDDQAETVLMRLIRGSGLQGLSAMKARNGSIIRPLLSTSRKDIISYIKKEELPYGIDITNKDPKFLRNKFRHDLIPYLEKNYNPNIKQLLSRTASIVADDYDFINQSSKKVTSKIATINLDKDSISVDVKKFQTLHPTIQKQSLRLFISDLKKDTTDIEITNIEELLKIFKSTKKKRQTLKFKGLNIERKSDKVIMIKM